MTTGVAGSSMEVFLIVMAILVLLLLLGGLYLIRDRANLVGDPTSSSFLARILLAEGEVQTRLDLEREVVAEERWKCLVCDFSNGLDRPTCVLCGTKRSDSRRDSQVVDLEAAMAAKRPADRLSVSGVPASSSPALQSLRLSTLNPRQRYARKRHEWIRHLAPDGTARWSRQLARTGSASSSRGSMGFIITAAPSTIDHRASLPLLEATGSSPPTPALRLTFAELSRADAAAPTIGGYKLPPSELAAIAHVSSLPFPRKYAWFLERVARLARSWEDGRIKLRVHRANVLVESMEQLLGIQVEHLRFPLRIEFVGEAGVDAGGLQREWFSLLFSQLLDDDLGLFLACQDGARSVAINPSSVECTADHLLYFRGAGRLMGRALLEGQPMPARLCLPILKHLLGVPITFSDLQFVDPALYRSLQWLRDAERSDEEVASLELTFAVDEPRDDGTVDTIDLAPDGRNVPVTKANVAAFVHAKLRYVVLDRYAEQLQALSLGLFEVVPQEALMVFDYHELELVLCGLPEIDVDDWKRNTQAQPPSFADAPVVAWFWDAVTRMGHDERARLLQFCTGSSRVPVQGFKALTSYDGRLCAFALRPLPGQTRGFPRVHTCFNRVELPMYATPKELEDALASVLELEWTEFSDE